ncbi:MAG: 3-keto-disaccharide hydrolase [Woeseiaceae bacterium]
MKTPPARLAPAVIAGLLLSCELSGEPQRVGDETWLALFNGRDLVDWIVKIRGYPAGENFAETFRVRDGLLSVAYDGYDSFGERFGHIFYKDAFSHYRLRVEYRFVGEPASGTPEWAFRNSGVMFHAQPPWTMSPEQDFPISLEFQFLGGLGNGRQRPTGNLCTPGTHVVIDGQFNDTHCIDSSSRTFDGDQWVMAELLVLGDERIVHYINGEAVIEYAGPTTGGGVVSGHRPELKPEGEPLRHGYIALQSEGHPIQFRRVELLDLEGCTDPQALNYRSYYVAADRDRCRY